MASAGKIKGITIVLDGDTTKLGKALSNVTHDSVKLHKELKEVERALKFEPGNAELIAQKQKILAENIELTTQRLKKLKDAQAQVEAQFKRGDISAEQYRAFRREVVLTESSLKTLKQKLADVGNGNSIDGLKNKFKQIEKSANDAKQKVSELGNELKSLAVGAIAGAGMTGVVQSALDLSDLNTKIDISFDVDKESKKVVKDSLREIEAYGVQGEEALEGLRRQWALNKNAGNEANAAIAKGAAAITKAYGDIDYKELIQETNEIGAALKISNEEALGLTNALLKAGFPPEQLDTVSEYGQQMKDAGFSAKEVQSIFEKGIDTKSWNIDNLNDGVKEARIRMAEMGMGLSKTMDEEIIPALALSYEEFNEYMALSSISAKKRTDEEQKRLVELSTRAGEVGDKFIEWGQAVAEGGKRGSDAMSEVVEFLDGVEDKTVRNALATEIFGTKWEDQGENLISVFKGLSSATDKSQANIEGLADTVKKIDASPAVQFRQAIADLKTALEPVLGVLAKIIGQIASWISANSGLATVSITLAGIGAAVTALGFAFKGLMIPINGVIQILGSFTSMASRIGTSIKGIGQSSTGLAGSMAQTAGAGQKAAGIFGSLFSVFGRIGQILGTIIGTFARFAGPVGIAITAVQALLFVLKEFFSVDLMQAGKDIISGLWNGLTSGLASIKDFIVNLATNIINWFKGILGINSPSRIFFEFGINIIQGLVQGIQSLFSMIVSVITTVGTTIITTMTNMMSGIAAFFQGVWDGVSNACMIAWNGIATFLSGIFTSISTTVTTVWNGILTFLQTTWQSIQNAISTVFTGISNTIQTIWTGITTFLQTTWTTIQTTATTVFSGLQTFFSTTLNGIKTVFTRAWNAMSTIVKTVWTTIRTTISTAFNSIKTFLSTGINAIKSFFVSGFTSMKNSVTNAFNGVKTVVTAALTTVKTAATNVLEGVKNVVTTVKTTISNAWNAVKSTTTSVFNAIKSAIVNPIEYAKNKVKAAVNAIQKFFSGLKLQLPKIKLPHFNLSGKFSLDPISVPKLSVSWYDKGGIFTGPQIIGVGEKRPEFVGALDDLREIVSASMVDVMGLTKGGITNGGSTYNNSQSYQPNITIVNQASETSPSEIARKSLQAQRQLAMEWGIN